ncbi:hypothetical protein EV128_12225 [Rhizobium azibense]|nr:hypothetical protein EV128_12225 [Rhizobium azibense]
MYSWGAAQWIVAVYLPLVTVGVPLLRYLMMDSGARGFVPWREFWSKWGGDFALKLALVGLLFWGGFWA